MFEKNRRIKYLITYTAFFIIIFYYAIFSIFIETDKSFIATYDSLDQHYLGFIYVGRWIRNLFEDLIFNHTFNFQMWDMSIGYGADAITTLSVYFGDPFYWISAFVPVEKTEFAFGLIIAIKIYLGGLSFSLLSREKGNSYGATLCGALVYAFAGSMYIGFLQTIFLNIMLLFPLVICGLERLRTKKKWGLYVVSLSLIFFTYFYFAYMASIFVFLYSLLSIFMDVKGKKESGTCVIRQISEIALFSILAIGLSAVLLLPTVYGMLGADRLQVRHYISFLYDIDWYKDFISRFFDWQWVGMDCYIGISAIAAPSLLILFFSRKKYTKLKIIFIGLTAGMLIPCFGHAMNGFSYVTNRWSWAYSLCLAFIVAKTLDEGRTFFEKKICLPIVSCAVYAFVIEGIFGKHDIETNITVTLVVVCCVFFAFTYKISEMIYWFALVILVCVTTICDGRFYFLNGFDTYKNSINARYGFAIIDYMVKDTSLEDIENSSALNILDDSKIDQGDRYDQYGIARVRNASYYHQISGEDFYASLYNNNIDRWHNSIALLTSPWNYGYSGLNRRSEIETLMNVKHYLIAEGNTSALPLEYSELETSGIINDDTYSSYAPANKTSLFYAFDKSVGYDTYNLLNPYERQQLIMQAVVIENSNEGLDGIYINRKKSDYSVIYSDGVVIEDNGFTVERDWGYFVVEIPQAEEAEIYLWFDNIDFSDGVSSSYYISANGMYGDNDVPNIYSGYDGLNYRNHMYGGKHNWLLNLGYTYTPVNRIKIAFSKAGKYTLDDMRIYARSGEEMCSSISGLNAVGDGTQIGVNTIETTVDVDDAAYIFASIPYSKGWKLFVDGKKTEILKADDAFVAFEVGGGKHVIKMEYSTPLMVAGVIISVLSFIISIAMKINRKMSEQGAL